MLSAGDARTLYGALSAAGVRCWVVGGWGVDALIGQRTRPHKDLDVLALRQGLRLVGEPVRQLRGHGAE